MTTKANRLDGWGWVLLALAATNIANGVWMLADAAGWYTDLPADVPDFGPLNEHFVRDIGAAFLSFGIAMGWAAFRPPLRGALVLVTTFFYVLHAAGHVYDTVSGTVSSDHWWTDLPGVYAPAVVLVGLCWVFLRNPPAEA